MRITPGVRDRSFVNDYEINDADFNLPIQVKTKYQLLIPKVIIRELVGLNEARDF